MDSWTMLGRVESRTGEFSTSPVDNKRYIYQTDTFTYFEVFEMYTFLNRTIVLLDIVKWILWLFQETTEKVKVRP